MIAENEKAPQIRVQLLPSPCHVISIHQKHGCKFVANKTMLISLSMPLDWKLSNKRKTKVRLTEYFADFRSQRLESLEKIKLQNGVLLAVQLHNINLTKIWALESTLIQIANYYYSIFDLSVQIEIFQKIHIYLSAAGLKSKEILLFAFLSCQPVVLH